MSDEAEKKQKAPKINKFPVAKIKRIIQSNEDVGKVSSNAPVIISKCLELFIEELVTETAKTTREKQAKTITINHLKETVEKIDKFDFLTELMNKN
eukprot:gene915-9824_t